jgi:hypothetical protein
MPSSLHRPTPFLDASAAPIDSATPPRRAAMGLLDGNTLVVSDRYGHGLDILERLHTLLEPPGDTASFEARQDFRRRFREASQRLLAPIHHHRVALAKAPGIGFLGELYPELSSFALPVAELEDLANAWRRYTDGVHLAVLGHKVHPFYGTYAPTRTSHLELFGTWLNQYQGARSQGIDVGTGCGVLALMLCRAGFAQVLATDNNPNAVESVRRELLRRPAPPPVVPLVADLLGEEPTPADLIVFNPPWTRGDGAGLLDRALTFEEGLFERFFDQASARLAPEGRLVLVFSNVMQLVQPDQPHPILTELERGRFTCLNKLSRRVKPASKDGRRRRTRERVEVWELARG